MAYEYPPLHLDMIGGNFADVVTSRRTTVNLALY
jgi:hypothetical protein